MRSFDFAILSGGEDEQAGRRHLLRLSLLLGENRIMARCSFQATTFWSLAFVSMAFASTAAQADEPSGPGLVELVLLSPTGEPLAEKEVTVQPIGDSWSPQRKPVPGQTNQLGKVSLVLLSDVKQVLVSVPDVGYGVSGLLNISPDHIARSSLPRLVPWATIQGQIPEEFLTPEYRVRLANSNLQKSEFLQPTADGSFQIQTFGGNVYLIIELHEGRVVARTQQALHVLPGESATIGPVEKLERPAATPDNSTESKQTRIIPRAEGTVTDAEGRPFSDTNVYALTTPSPLGRFQSSDCIRVVRTDSQGRYKIKGEANSPRDQILLLVHVPGYLPAWNWLPYMQDEDPSPATADLVLSKGGGALEVQLLRQGQPVVGEWVSVKRDQGIADKSWEQVLASDELETLAQELYPRRMTDERGFARFEHLPPGRYEILSCPHDVVLTPRYRGFSYYQDKLTGTADGIAVRDGSETRFRLNTYPHSVYAPLQIRNVDGEPLEDTTLDFRATTTRGLLYLENSLKVDATGTAMRPFRGTGLWSVQNRFLGEGRHELSIRQLPYFEAAGVVAVSPILAGQPPATFTAMAMQPAQVAVQLLDENGQPLQAFAQVGKMIGSADASGMVRFEGVPLGKVEVRGSAVGMQPVPFGKEGDTLPDDELFRAHQRMLPRQKLTLSANSGTRIDLRVDFVGYVRGNVKLPAGKTTADYNVQLSPGQREAGAAIQYQAESGEFAAGPFREGITRLQLLDRETEARMNSIEFAVQSGEVTQLDAVAPEQANETQSLRLGRNKFSPLSEGHDELEGVAVKMADGKTPAVGAVAHYLNEQFANPWSTGLADGLGVLHAPDRMSYSPDLEPPPNADDPKGPIIVALLPGMCGGVFTTPTPGNNLVLTLPAPQQVKGQVTVGGAPPTGLKGQVRVVAAYQDHGRLNSLLSVETTADADGHFVLAGLTPGKYVVQAALDYIWLSKSISITAGDKPLGDLQVNIAEPGGAASVLLADATGKPLQNSAITIDRPAGPLAERCWPAELFSDGAGRVFIPTLEAGQHTFHVQADGSEHQLTIPPLPAKEVTEVTVKLKPNE